MTFGPEIVNTAHFWSYMPYEISQVKETTKKWRDERQLVVVVIEVGLVD